MAIKFAAQSSVSRGVDVASSRFRLALIALAAPLMIVGAAKADAISDFYKGKQVFFVHSGGEGGGYATYAQTFAPYMAKHIPGNPKVVVQSMPGAGGIRLMQFFGSVAPKDGTYLGLVQSGASFVPLMGTAVGTIDPRKLNWIGAMSRVAAVCAAWSTSGIATFQDMLDKEFIVGASGAGSLTETQPALLNKLYGTKIKIVSGYHGANDIYLAMERGELGGRCGSGVQSMDISRPGWVSGGKVKIPIQFAVTRSSGLPDVPTAYELAKDDRVREVMKLVLAPVEMNRPLFTAPDVPKERVEALRAAFHAAIEDPEFLQEARRARLEIEENRGENVAKIIAEAYRLPADIVAVAKEAMTAQGAVNE